MSSTVLKHSTPTRGTNSENQTNDIPPKPPNNLDVALQTFIGKFIPSESAKVSVEQILRGISHNAELLCKPQAKQPRTTSLHHPTCDVSSMTVVHKLDAFTEKLVSENIKLKEENEVLKEQIVVLQEKCSRVAASNVSSPSPESVASSISGDIPQDPSTGESLSSLSTTTLTTEEINHFNKLPKDLKQFYEQMKTGKYSSEIYSKCNSTKSVFTKRKRVFKHMQDYPSGIDQCFKDYKGKSPTWIYNNVVRSKRS